MRIRFDCLIAGITPPLLLNGCPEQGINNSSAEPCDHEPDQHGSVTRMPIDGQSCQQRDQECATERGEETAIGNCAARTCGHVLPGDDMSRCGWTCAPDLGAPGIGSCSGDGTDAEGEPRLPPGNGEENAANEEQSTICQHLHPITSGSTCLRFTAPGESGEQAGADEEGNQNGTGPPTTRADHDGAERECGHCSGRIEGPEPEGEGGNRDCQHRGHYPLRNWKHESTTPFNKPGSVGANRPTRSRIVFAHDLRETL